MPHEINAVAVDGIPLANQLEHRHRVELRQFTRPAAAHAPPTRQAEPHRRDDDEAVSFGEVGRAIEEHLHQRRDVEAVQIHDQRCRLSRRVARRDEQRVRQVGVGVGEVVGALEDALLRRRQRRLRGTGNALEAA
jgi:hypothetical protein